MTNHSRDLQNVATAFRLPELHEAARAQRTTAYLVGGCLRDILVGRPVREVDLAVDCDPFDLAKAVARLLKGAFVPLDITFGIARVVVKRTTGAPLQYDICRFKGKDIGEDLTRRDFTVNALGLDLAAAIAGDLDRLQDPTGGQQDLTTKTMRAVSAAAIPEDPLRIIRAFRIGAKLGFAVAPETMALMEENVTGIDRIAAERISEEMLRLLEHPASAPHIRALRKMGLLARIIPVQSVEKTSYLEAFEGWRPVAAGSPASALATFEQVPACYGVQQDTLLKLAGLLLDCGSVPLSDTRFRIATKDTVFVDAILTQLRSPAWAHWTDLPDDLSTYQLFKDRAAPMLGALLLDWIHGTESPKRPLLEGVLTAYSTRHAEVIDPPRLIDGRELMQLLGIRPGPQVGELLERVREAQVVGKVRTRQDAVDLLNQKRSQE